MDKLFQRSSIPRLNSTVKLELQISGELFKELEKLTRTYRKDLGSMCIHILSQACLPANQRGKNKKDND